LGKPPLASLVAANVASAWGDHCRHPLLLPKSPPSTWLARCGREKRRREKGGGRSPCGCRWSLPCCLLHRRCCCSPLLAPPLLEAAAAAAAHRRLLGRLAATPALSRRRQEGRRRERIQYAKTKSDVIAKADGTFVPRERRKRHDERAERKRREQQHDTNQVGVNIPPAYATYGAAPPLHYPGGSKSMLPEAPAPPNNILFVQSLPHETTPMMLQMLFCQYPGFKEVRMVEAKPGIAFVEYGDEMQATVSMQSLQGFKITPQYPMLITYAKK
ncbi:hypothetical protein Taro_025429, partial [Colocasia esculenta]|nr:hypothetical protein [Colocasia esculenta]